MTAKNKFQRSVLYLLPLLLWMGIVLIASTRLGSYAESMKLIQWTAETLSPESMPLQDVWQLYQINNAARKIAHIFAFGIFTMLAVRALQWGSPRLKWQSLVGALVICLLFGTGEAFVRYRSPVRHVRMEQFVFNGAGSLLVFAFTTGYFGVKSWERSLWKEPDDIT